jgi:hypothetical protein
VPAFCVLYRLTRARRVAPARGRCRCAPALCCCTSAWANVTACWKWHEHRPSVVGAIGIPVCLLTSPFTFLLLGGAGSRSLPLRASTVLLYSCVGQCDGLLEMARASPKRSGRNRYPCVLNVTFLLFSRWYHGVRCGDVGAERMSSASPTDTHTQTEMRKHSHARQHRHTYTHRRRHTHKCKNKHSSGPAFRMAIFRQVKRLTNTPIKLSEVTCTHACL